MGSKFDAVFKDQGPAAKRALEELAGTINRSKFDLMAYAATLQDTFVPLGFARDKAAEMSVQVVALAEDLASFNNLNTADVVNDLQSALVGNTETLRKYGVVAQDAQIKQKLLEMGLWDGKSAIDAQAKAMAILQLALDGTADAQGDAVRTADGYANTVRGVQASVKELQIAIADGYLPVAAKFAQTMGTGIKVLTQLVTWNEQITAALNEHAEAVDKSDASYEDYVAELTRAAKAAGYQIDAEGNLVEVNVTRYETTTKLIQANYLLSESERDTAKAAEKSNDARGEEVVALRAATSATLAKQAADRAAQAAAEELAAAEEELATAADTQARIFRLAEEALAAANVPLVEKLELERQLAIASGASTEAQEREKDAIDFLRRQYELGNIDGQTFLNTINDLAAGAISAQQAIDLTSAAINNIPNRDVTITYHYQTNGSPPSPAAGDVGLGGDAAVTYTTTDTGTVSYGGAQAAGGAYDVRQPTMFLAGESGPERAIFIPQGKSLADVVGSSGQAMTIYQTVNFQISNPDPNAVAQKVSVILAAQARMAKAAGMQTVSAP
jgi:hypothetical protein